MQGVICSPENLQSGSPPPNNPYDLTMEASPDVRSQAKDKIVNQSDSGIFSTTTNSLDTTRDSHTNTENYDTDNRSDCSSPDCKYFCPVCNMMLTSQHDFTLHIKSHNNEQEIIQDTDKGFQCRICHKVLSSSSSLDRHVLVHSGERPFTCKYCGDTFTTNGNMHRHMRTHKSKNYESDASTDSVVTNKSTEFNNNKVENSNIKKRKLEECEDKEVLKKKPPSEVIRCPLCERCDFTSLQILEHHLEDNHPDYPTKCHQCNQMFSNYHQLKIHCNVVHDISPNKTSVVGFKDLTFVDFSSEKFPHIARYECEKNMHKVSGSLKFQCRKCTRAFPCASSLEFHEKDCSILVNGVDLAKLNEADFKRNDFFARLNLQDNSPEKPSPNKLRQQLLAKAMSLDNTKDLADIQSIISMTTSNNLLQQLHNKAESKAEVYENKDDDELQDAFAVEFRKMKLRGEFPCRLCTAIFPNLRALKGHNRAHLNGNNNGTYRCNMCPHSSIDKAALIRHMRTHNGDRPYECSICNYAFTTKANCERHLRNRHAKTTREEVKKSIIYHPSEDPTNDDVNKSRDEPKRQNLNVSSSTDISDNSPEKIQSSTPKVPADMPKFGSDLLKNGPNLLSNFHPMKEGFLPLTGLAGKDMFPHINDVIRNENLKALKQFRMQNGASMIPPYFAPPPYNLEHNLVPPAPSKINVKSLELLKQPSYDSEEEYDETEPEEPMDLVLDLSKKKTENHSNDRKEVDSPEDLTVKSPPLANDFFAAQHLLKSPPKIDPAALYAQWALYRNGFPGFPNWPGLPINPLFFQNLPAPPAPPMTLEMKERLRNQLCGGSVVTENFSERIPPQFMRSASMFNGFKLSDDKIPEPTSPKKHSELKVTVDQSYPESLSSMQSPVSNKSDLLASPNSVKMVIKNGVLMPKQKQRRYRTERPFTCEHCSARFTLRSNMERHIKQQHPQFWSQRQRGAVGNPGRKPQSLPLKPNYCDLSIPSYDAPKQDYDDKEDISEKLKFAILAQHLKNKQFQNHFNIKKEEEEDDNLVIDEYDEGKHDNYERSESYEKSHILEDKLREIRTSNSSKKSNKLIKNEEDLVPVSRLLDNASQQQFKEYFKRDSEENGNASEEDEEGLVASGSTSEGNISGTDENRSESEATSVPVKKKSAYSLAPNRVSCPYCSRKFPWTSSLRRHILTHTGQKPFKCSHCPLLFTTKSNCDRHLLRKHGNTATTITNEALNNNTTNFLMRNVPERPFKCSSCPSSTFSTYNNLKKHISCKHATNAQGDDIKAQGYEAGSSEDEKITQEHKPDWEAQINQAKFNPPEVQNVAVPNSDQPFKCHLCESSFIERQECLDHIKAKHASEYDLLMSKNALDTSASAPEDVHHNSLDDEETDLRGRFPDYSNRKVICAFCMRRFWSAEDLRRHMRTHTGERPFSCDICRRRFTLKHSMLRHRKKHLNSFDGETNVNSDEEVHRESEAKPDDSGKTDESDNNEGGDLISNLLGIRPSFIDKVLTATADDAAKLLGVKNGVRE